MSIRAIVSDRYNKKDKTTGAIWNNINYHVHRQVANNVWDINLRRIRNPISQTFLINEVIKHYDLSS